MMEPMEAVDSETDINLVWSGPISWCGVFVLAMFDCLSVYVW